MVTTAWRGTKEMEQTRRRGRFILETKLVRLFQSHILLSQVYILYRAAGSHQPPTLSDGKGMAND
jgi:hypothetical protein